MSLIPKSEFVGLEGVSHLCTGGEAPWLRSHDAACARFGRLKSAGMAGREEIFRVYERAKERVSRRLGVPPERIAFLAHSSEGLNQAVRAVDWRPGDNAVFADLEYPSLIFPVAALAERGVEPDGGRDACARRGPGARRHLRLRGVVLLQVAARHPRRRHLRL